MSTISQFDGENMGQHISEAELLALLKRCLTPVQTARLQNHLLDCEQCHELYQDASDFCLPRRTAEAVVSEAQIQASWNRLKPRLRQAEPRAAAAARPPVVAVAAGASWGWALPLAAVLFVLLSTVTVLLWRQRQPAAEPARAADKTPAASAKPPVNPPAQSANQPETVKPQAAGPTPAMPKTAMPATDKSPALAIHDVTTLVLNSGEKGEAEATPANLFQIPARAQQLRFKLTKYKPAEFPSYQVELLDAAGEVKQVVTGSITKDKLIEAIFRRAGLPDGEYQLRVTGQGRAGGDLTPLTTHPVKLSFNAN